MTTLVMARAGLTNYFHNQVIRNSVMDIDSSVVDVLTQQNLDGGISPSTLREAAVMSAGLNFVPDDFANIMGGFNESKGILQLKLLARDTTVSVEYLNVIGYITNNSAVDGLTRDAVFTPVMSWKSHETLTASLDINNPTTVRRQMGGRTDYLLNDGSSYDSNVCSLRPNDVIDFSINNASQDDVLAQMVEEGLDGYQPTTIVGAADIGRVGVVASKRANTNPFLYSEELLKAGTSHQAKQQISSDLLDQMGDNPSAQESMYDSLTDLSYRSSNREPSILRDEFFVEMQGYMGKGSLKGFRGYTIGDLLMVFENLNEVLDVVFMDKNEFPAVDYTQHTDGFGTSTMEEVVSQEITLNLLDLMMKNGLTEISLRGSNCDNFIGDGSMDNIVILPFNPFSVEEDDFELGNKCEQVCEELRGQIFAKLNGLRTHELRPIRFSLTAELFGTAVLNVTTVNENNMNELFSLDDSGIGVGPGSRAFPTYALNNFTSVRSDRESAIKAGANFFTNLQEYFK